jgi:hypothetical protein
LQGRKVEKKLRKMMIFLDKSTRCRCGIFHKYPFISGSYENEAAGQAQKYHTLRLQPPLFPTAYSFTTHPQTHVQEQQAAADGI